MNKTLLLILCDFLLLTLLALTRWESAEPPRPTQPPPVAEVGANAVTREQDLVESMRQSLASEQETRNELTKKLASADSTLAAREQSLSQLQAERTKLAQERNAVAATLGETQRAAAELAQKATAASQEASMTKEQLAQLQRELAERQAEADRQRQALTALEKQQADSRKQIEGLTMAVVVAEQEKKNLRETAETLKGQVETERSERAKVQETATQLAQGVGQLAEKSGELTKEIRENRPVNANVLFNDFLGNRVTATFRASRKVFIGNPTRTKDATTVLVTDGRQVYALMHIADTPFVLGENGVDWESLSVELAHDSSNRVAAGAVQFLGKDPRIVVVPLDASQASALGARVYPLAADPFKFPEAVLIDGSGRGYGEVGFKLDASNPAFVRVDNRFFKRLFGDFAPKRGDLVFAKTGEILGIMVNNDYCAVAKDFTPMKTIQAGPDIRAQNTGATFDQIIARVRALPLNLQ
jgi:X-X-X-Leu-X-X-Gly heptad repeat protein